MSCTPKEASEYATVYISRDLLDSAENKVQKGDSLENIYDNVDELSIREVENATEESCDTKVVPQCMKMAFDAVGTTEDTASKLLDERRVPPDSDSSESTYQEIADPSVQSSTYAHLYSTLPLHQGERADTLHQAAADVTETRSNKEEAAAISDGEDTAAGSREKQEQL